MFTPEEVDRLTPLVENLERVISELINSSEEVDLAKKLFAREGFKVYGFEMAAGIVRSAPQIQAPMERVKDGCVLPGTFSSRDHKDLREMGVLLNEE